jgi:hypothetical protein
MHTFQDDETLARHASLGVLCHFVITTLAARTRTPDVLTIMAAVAEALPPYGQNEGRAHQQNAAGAVSTFFNRLLPPPCWHFHGAEVSLGRGRVDLLWQDRDGRLLLDELKTGRPELLATTSNQEQVARYLRDGTHIFGDALVGIRLVCTSNPRRSQFLQLGTPAVPLFTTPHVNTPTSTQGAQQ